MVVSYGVLLHNNVQYDGVVLRVATIEVGVAASCGKSRFIHGYISFLTHEYFLYDAIDSKMII